MVLSLSDFNRVPPEAFDASGALDPILGIDTQLFIDPALLRVTTVPELAGSYAHLTDYFDGVLPVIRAIASDGDVAWRKADQMLTFPEMKGLCIGYSSDGVAGRGMGRKKRAKLLESTTLIVRNGILDPTLFELIGAFEEGVGPDLISDMIAKIIAPDLIAFTQRVWPCPRKTYSIAEWHLLCALGMTVLRDFPASLGARHLQPGIRLRPPLSHSWLDATGPMADLALGDQRE